LRDSTEPGGGLDGDLALAARMWGCSIGFNVIRFGSYANDTKTVKPKVTSIAQIRGARGLLGWSQAELARAAGLSEPTIKRFETKGAKVSDAAVAKMRAALEADGVEFTNGDQPGVWLRSYKLKDAGQEPFPIDLDLIGFGATDGKRDITIHVERSALAYLDDQRIGSGAEHMRAFYRHSHRILGIAAEKYDPAGPADVVLVTQADVARG
jgi:transcriptional regulator with XRE-family HTH domain